MYNYKLVVQYDGSRYDGWQRQGNTTNTIQNKLESVLSRITDTQIGIQGAGRTDAGVHAKGQVATFLCETYYDTNRLLSDMNHYLPEDIAVIEVTSVELRFHARLSATAKRYIYRIHNSDIPDVFQRKYAYSYTGSLNLDRMKAAADFLVGTHDFKSFCSNKKMKKSTVRTIYSIEIQMKQREIQISFHGNGFLYNMIRIIVGTLIEIGRGDREPEEILEILEKKDRIEAGYTAPPCGLTLLDVEY